MIEQAISSYDDEPSEPNEPIRGSYFGIEENHMKIISDISDSLINELDRLYGGHFFHIISKVHCCMKNTRQEGAFRILVRIYSGYKKGYKEHHSFLWNLLVYFDEDEVVSFSEIKESIAFPRCFDVAMNRAGIISPGAKDARKQIAFIKSGNPLKE